jgi:superfamily II DNA or RNA helicase
MNTELLSAIQIEALEHINNSYLMGINPICSLDAGLGKTWVACEVIKKIISYKENSYRILIVHKASNHKDPWLKELKNFNFITEPKDNQNTNYEYIYIHGKDRIEKYVKGNKYLFTSPIILLTSYETLCLDIEHNYYNLNDNFDLIIFDELHTIINHKRLTKKCRYIYQIPAFNKLVLTATPVQNDTKELGLLFAFLNDKKGFTKIVKRYSNLSNINKEEKKNKQKEIENSLLEYNELCVRKNALFYYSEDKSGFIKNAIILSLPIDDEMYFQIPEEYENESDYDEEEKDKKIIITPKQRIFLSHPAAVKKEDATAKMTRCTKADAVRIILYSMLNDEKAIIFSLYIDVLNVYADICQEIGFSVIKITGDDKGNKLKDKLIAFENSKKVRVLLTTLQKSAEGFNFFFATHVIILEFWWNPQKIIQAMSRIDRKTQTRNIFIYLLCYNYKGEMIKQEKCFYDKMVKKLSEANETYQRIEQNHPKKTPELKPIYNAIPKIIKFLQIDSFESEVSAYIKEFIHTGKNYELNYDVKGFALKDTREQMIKYANDYLHFNSILENFPWKIEYQDVKEYLNWYYINRVYGKHGISLFNSIEKNNYNFNQKLNKHYKAVYFDRFNLYIKLIFDKQEELPLIFVIGIRTNGKYDLFGIYYCLGDNTAFIFEDIKKRGVRHIGIFITKMTYFNLINNNLDNYYPKTKLQCCMAYLHKLLIEGVIIKTNELIYFDMILSAKTFYKALRICEEAKTMGFENKSLFEKLIEFLPTISWLYKFKPAKRSILCTTNIITYITNLCLIFTKYKVFNYPIEAITFINIASNKILEEGEHFIPNWDKITSKIDQ